MADGTLPLFHTAARRAPVAEAIHTVLTDLLAGELIIDLFAGGGGVSEGFKLALGREPDYAINHDEWAIGMHAINHPFTQHLRESVWNACPLVLAAGRPVGWVHASPDCRHFSQAKGGQPRAKNIRGLAWVLVKFAGKLAKVGNAPRLLSLENVRQVLSWGNLIAKRCNAAMAAAKGWPNDAIGRVLTIDEKGKPNGYAAKNERVPLQKQFLIPDPKRVGRTWNHFVRALRKLGYVLETRRLRMDYLGAGTSRERLFMVARRDGIPIQWPAQDHGLPGMPPIISAAESIDWSIPPRTIFGRARPLAQATMRRIARGVFRHVINTADPFIVPVTHTRSTHVRSARLPLPTITTACGGELAVCAPVLVPRLSNGPGKAISCGAERSLAMVPEMGKTEAAAIATLVQTAHGEGKGPTKRRGSGHHNVKLPVPTITATGNSIGVVTAHVAKFKGTSLGVDARAPIPTITSGAGAARPAGCAHSLGVVSADLQPVSPTGTGRTMVTAYVVKFYGQGGQFQSLRQPLHTLRTKGCMSTIEVMHVHVDDLTPEQLRMARLVTAFLREHLPEHFCEPADVMLVGDMVMLDIAMRMISPRELFRASSFRDDYIIDRTADGRELKQAPQVRMCGNSVPPIPFSKLIRSVLSRQALPLAA